MSSSHRPDRPSAPSPGDDRPAPPSARLARVGIPATLLVLAVVAAVAVSFALAVVLAGAALVAVIADLWIRLGISSQDDRDREARARRFFLRRGRWPDERP